MQAGHDELTLQARGEHVIGIAELGQALLQDVDGIHPPEQRRVGLGHLQRDLGPPDRAHHQAQRLLQTGTGGFLTRVPAARLVHSSTELLTCAARHRERGVAGNVLPRPTGQQWARRGRQQRFPLAWFRRHDPPLEELPPHAIGEVGLQFGPRARTAAYPQASACRHASLSSDVLPSPAPPAMTSEPPPAARRPATAASSGSRSISCTNRT
jgi:hypothetical protein